jgi:phosphoglycolate phosphatase
MLVIFDFDGVVANSLDQFVLNAAAVSAAMGYRVDLDSDLIKNLEIMEFEYLAIALGIPESEAGKFSENMLKAFSSGPRILPIHDGMFEVISELSKGHDLGIISGNSFQCIDQCLEHYGMKPWFSFVFAKEDSGSKPDKLDQAMRTTHYDKQSTVYIGDAKSDVESARTAGIPSIAVTWGNQNTDILIKSDPTYIVSEPADILAIIESLERGERTTSSA